MIESVHLVLNCSHMIRIVLIFLLASFPFSFLSAQEAPHWDAAQIEFNLEKLNTVGRVLYLAAHPDDENTALLGWLSNNKKYRTAYLALTRGDGGQNLVGNEQGSYLGLIRTQELLAARRTDGAEQFFSRANDFGFSKTAKETFSIWGHDRILADVVWVIRKFRPDVIICRFPEDKRAGHGHHWASAVLAHEAFDAAADPSRFPDQLQDVQPWQAKRILWNTFRFGDRNTTAPDQLQINIGGYNPLLGKSYGEIAAQSRSNHKSQGFGAAPSYGVHTEFFKTIAGSAPKESLMDGVPTRWSAVKNGAAIGKLLDLAIQQFDVAHPEKTVPALLKVRAALAKLPDTALRAHKMQQTDALILACSGLLLQATTNQPYAVNGTTLQVNTQVINQSTVPIQLTGLDVAGQHKTYQTQLSEDTPVKNSLTIPIANEPVSQPYWLRKRHPLGYYEIPGQQWVGRPENPPALSVRFHLTIDGQQLEISRPLRYAYTDPVKGLVREPLIVAPPATAAIANELYMYTRSEAQQVEVKVHGYRDQVNGTVHLQAPEGYRITNNDQPFSLADVGSEQTLTFTVAPGEQHLSASNGHLQAILQIDGKQYDRDRKVIALSYLPLITVFPFAEAQVVSVPLQGIEPNQRIGYIMGAGDKMPQMLRQMGYQVTLLSDQQLATGDLQQYDALVTGIRAYNTRPRLKYVQHRLMDYVKNGGVLVEQYNKNFDLVANALGPYPFTVTRDRVTDENAAVDFLLPDDPVLQYPNAIGAADFKGWVQERGLYFVDPVDHHYRQPLAMHDPEESPMSGSLIVADYGKGKYVYTALAFFRQLPAGVPGAFRLFANLLAPRTAGQ